NEGSGYLSYIDIMSGAQLRDWLGNATPEQRNSYERYMDAKAAGDYSFINKDNFEQFKSLASKEDLGDYVVFRERVAAGDFSFLDKLN
ncbi:hypothetical protein, partial [Enterococcus faecalis]|uniref:hypothetical protein n=1 Tax=Enterococcus faecalis TaxID=1351 RepID=UPI00403F149E